MALGNDEQGRTNHVRISLALFLLCLEGFFYTCQDQQKEYLLTSVKKDMTELPVVKRIFIWGVTGCRIVVGLLVMKTGIDLMRGGIFTGYNRQDPFLVGGFVTIIGLYFICSSLFHVLSKKDT